MFNFSLAKTVGSKEILNLFREKIIRFRCSLKIISINLVFKLDSTNKVVTTQSETLLITENLTTKVADMTTENLIALSMISTRNLIGTTPPRKDPRTPTEVMKRREAGVGPEIEIRRGLMSLKNRFQISAKIQFRFKIKTRTHNSFKILEAIQSWKVKSMS